MSTPLTHDSLVGDIAANLPGAAGLFRQHGISFCCGGGQTLTEAAAKAGIGADALLEALATLKAAALTDVPTETPALIDHILTRYHQTHRAELAELVLLSEKVEAVHGDHDAAPLGLTALLDTIRYDMEDHMQKEEQILFPMMRQGVTALHDPVAVMRAEHESHANQLKALEHLTHGFTAPEGACRSWLALYAGARKFSEDLVRHMQIENDLLFPRFEPVTA